MQQYVVIGLGRFGYSLATTLYKLGHEVIAIDINEDKIEDIADEVTYAVHADATDEDALEALGIKRVDRAIIAIATNIQSSILASLNVLELGINMVWAKAKNEQHRKALSKIGVHRIFQPEKDMGNRVAHLLSAKNILEIIDLDPKHSIIEIYTPKCWENRSLEELDLRTKYGINVIALKKEKGFNILPKADDILEPGDLLAIIGENKKLNKFRENI